jgi:hypothetical protein
VEQRDSSIAHGAAMRVPKMSAPIAARIPYRPAASRDQRVAACITAVRRLRQSEHVEIGELRPWTPLTRGQQRLWRLLKRRSTLVRAKVQLRQSLTDMGTLQAEVDSLLRHCVRMIAKLDRELLAQAKELGWSESIARCRAIPGIGPLTAMALVVVALSGQRS